MLRVQSYLPAGTHADEPSGYVTLAHDQRHLRRKLLHLQNDEMVMLDLKEAVLFAHGDLLVVENGDLVEVRAANEKLFEITAKSPVHLIELAWHLGNRHLSAQIEEDRILILRDHVIRAMLEGLGAKVRDVEEPFQPARGAYHAHGGHSHGSHSHNDHGHGDHGHGSHGHHHHD
jgi:urease accessory protein